MQKTDLGELAAFFEVARAQSFTRAAAQMGVSPSALSHSIRALEQRLGVRLLNRTTRSVSPTEAGERLLRNVGPRMDDIQAELKALIELRDKPAGRIRINTTEHVATTIVAPALAKFLPKYPDIHVETFGDSGLTDIVAQRYDAGIRLGEQVEKDMVAVPVGPQLRMATVATPAYLAKHPAPKTPRDLTEHNCINAWLSSYGGLYAWEYEKNGREIRVRVSGQMTFNTGEPIVAAALAGLGIAHLPDDMVAPFLAQKKLVRMLESWCPPFPGYYLYYPSRKQPSAAFALLVEALRYRG